MPNENARTDEAFRVEQKLQLGKANTQLHETIKSLWKAYQMQSDPIIKSRILICYNKIMAEYEYLQVIHSSL